MSMRLKGRLMKHLHAQLEQQLFRNAVVFENVSCEMTFQTAQGYMEFEGENHSYLPVFHLIGSIKDIRGTFPYHISSIYFDDKDKPYLTKNILYYPNPQELAHMIQVGKFYTKDFVIPEILDKQEYSFPAKVNLTIIPPPNEALYERATAGGDFVAETDEEKLNIPIVYLEMAGSGVTRKTDKLLDYYGIDFEDGFEVYPLTAESSGYVDPPLMMYMEEPAVKNIDYAMQNQDEMYISKEEEAKMIRSQKEREAQAQQQAEPVMHEDYSLTNPEDILIAQADRRVEQRVNERLKQDALEKQTQRETSDELGSEHGLEEQTDRQNTEEHDSMYDLSKDTTDGDFIFVGDDSEKTVSEEQESNDMFLTDDVAEEQTTFEFSSEDSSSVFIQDDVVQEVVQPDEPQQQVDVQMNLGSENATYDGQKKDDLNDKASGDGIVREDSDVADMEDRQGGDVSDARLQAKLDEAHTKDLAKDAAQAIQADIVQEDDRAVHGSSHTQSVDVRVHPEKDSGKKDAGAGRSVPAFISEIADKYDASRAEMMNGSSELGQ